MINAKEELIYCLSKDKYKNKRILCARIEIDHLKINNNLIVLKKDYSEQDYLCFLEKLNFEYDNGYGLQFLCGLVLFDDHTWLERDEYDGSEWWDYKCFPEIPKECL